MKKIGIFYGSTTGTTERVANEIARFLGIDKTDVHDVSKSMPSDTERYDVILLGSSTWGAGDLQDDWEYFSDGLKSLDLSGHKVALFGCGDESMSDTFCGAVGTIYEIAKATGAELIGEFNVDGYEFSESTAVVDGVAVGLLLDEVNKPELTESRIKAWTDEIHRFYLQVQK